MRLKQLHQKINQLDNSITFQKESLSYHANIIRNYLRPALSSPFFHAAAMIPLFFITKRLGPALMLRYPLKLLRRLGSQLFWLEIVPLLTAKKIAKQPENKVSSLNLSQ